MTGIIAIKCNITNSKPVHRLLDSSFTGVNRSFVLLFKKKKKNSQREKQTRYCLASVEIKGLNVLSGGRNILISLLNITVGHDQSIHS